MTSMTLWKRPSLTSYILLAVVAGMLFGALLPGPAKELRILGTLFLRFIKSIIAPLVFATLVTGIGGSPLIAMMISPDRSRVPPAAPAWSR